MLAADVLASQKKDLLLPAMMTFLAAEGCTAVYRIEAANDPPSLPQLCDARIERIARHTEVAVGFRRFRFLRSLTSPCSDEELRQEDDDARLGSD
jgi:hypothetical protein